MKNGLYELDVDLLNYGKDKVMWKLLITFLSLQLATIRWSRSKTRTLLLYAHKELWNSHDANGIHRSFLKKYVKIRMKQIQICDWTWRFLLIFVATWS